MQAGDAAKARNALARCKENGGGTAEPR